MNSRNRFDSTTATVQVMKSGEYMSMLIMGMYEFSIQYDDKPITVWLQRSEPQDLRLT